MKKKRFDKNTLYVIQVVPYVGDAGQFLQTRRLRIVSAPTPPSPSRLTVNMKTADGAAICPRLYRRLARRN